LASNISRTAVARVIDQYVDAAETLLGRCDGGVDLPAIGDIERQDERLAGVTFGDVRDFRCIARRDHRAPAACQHQFRQFAAEAR
jgi:hypothetical protein